MWGVTWTAMLLSLLWAMPAVAQETLGDLRAKAIQGDSAAQRNLAGCLGPGPTSS
jgi:lauroyl/myristoyl acyltransferase